MGGLENVLGESCLLGRVVCSTHENANPPMPITVVSQEPRSGNTQTLATMNGAPNTTHQDVGKEQRDKFITRY